MINLYTDKYKQHREFISDKKVRISILKSLPIEGYYPSDNIYAAAEKIMKDEINKKGNSYP